VKSSYLASPPLVIAFALAGTIAIDMELDPLGVDSLGNPIYLKDIWPSKKEIHDLINKYLTPKLFEKEYKDIFKGNKFWNELKPSKDNIYQWDINSTYIRKPPYFQNFSIEIPYVKDIENARILAILGNSITTDHISPAGYITRDSPAGKYLFENSTNIKDFNSFGSRRGNHEIMIRGTFGNIMIKNKLVKKEGGWTIYFPTNEEISIYDAAIKYQQIDIPLVVIAGKEYGTGSSRDWAAKGPALLGIKAVIAESFERIHRSNLIGMGILPLQFKQGQNVESLGLIGNEFITILGINELKPSKDLKVKIRNANNDITYISVTTRLDTPIEIEYYRNGGILNTILRNLLKTEKI
jgi:aconitate hydratase